MAAATVADTMAAGMAQGMAVGTAEGIPTGMLGGMAVTLITHIIRIMAAVLGPCRGIGKPAGIPTCKDIWRYMFLLIPILIAAHERMAIRL